jgi:hypothetical protein
MSSTPRIINAGRPLPVGHWAHPEPRWSGEGSLFYNPDADSATRQSGDTVRAASPDQSEQTDHPLATIEEISSPSGELAMEDPAATQTRAVTIAPIAPMYSRGRQIVRTQPNTVTITRIVFNVRSSEEESGAGRTMGMMGTMVGDAQTAQRVEGSEAAVHREGVVVAVVTWYHQGLQALMTSFRCFQAEE